MNKRGQFFLIAALVIVGALFSIGTVYTSVHYPKTDPTVESLSEELSQEGARVIDGGVYNGLSDGQINSNLRDLVATYSQTTDKEITFIYGNGDVLYYGCDYVTTSVGSQTGVTSCRKELTGKLLAPCDLSTSVLCYEREGTNKIRVRLQSTSAPYEFDLNSGDSFYLIIEKERGDEKAVSTN